MKNRRVGQHFFAIIKAESLKRKKIFYDNAETKGKNRLIFHIYWN